MNNKSYLKKIVKEEYKKLTTRSIESIIKEEYEKIILEQDEEVIKINKDNWRFWWNSDNKNDSKFEPKVSAVEYAEDAVSIFEDELQGTWIGNETSNYKDDPDLFSCIVVNLAESFVNYLGKTAQTTRDGKIFLDPDKVDSPLLKVTSRTLFFRPDGIVKVAYTLSGQKIRKNLKWFIDTDKNGVDIININQSSNQEERTYIGSLYNVAGSVVIKKQDDISYANYQLDRLQTIFDWSGLAPVIGVPIDIINTVLYLGRGRWGSAIFSAIAIVPYFGDALRAGQQALAKIVKSAGFSTSRFNRLSRSMWKGSLDSIAEFYNALLKNDDIVKKLVPSGKSTDAATFLKEELSKVDDQIKQLQEWLKTDRLLIPDVLEDAMRVSTKEFGNFIVDNVNVLTEFQKLGKVQGRFKLKPDFEFLASLPPEKIGLVDSTIQFGKNQLKNIKNIKVSSLLRLTGKFSARAIGAKYTYGLSEATIFAIRKTFAPLFNPKYIKPIEQAYSKLVMEKILKNPSLMASIAQNMPKQLVDDALGGAENVRTLVRNFLRREGDTFAVKSKEIEQTIKRNDFWTDVEIVDQLKGTVDIAGKRLNSGELLLSYAAQSNNPAFNLFFGNKQWQYETLFKRNLDFLYNAPGFKGKLAFLVKEYLKIKRNIFGRKSLDIWWNEWTELASTLGLTPTESANPDSVFVPFIFGVIDVSGDTVRELTKLNPFGPATGPPDLDAAGSNLGATRKALTNNRRGTYLTNLLDKYLKTITAFGTVFEGNTQLSQRLYKFIFTDRIQQVLRDPEGAIRIPPFYISKATYNNLLIDAKNKYGKGANKFLEPGTEVENMMKIFDEEFWNRLDPDVRENLASLREGFENALKDQLFAN